MLKGYKILVVEDNATDARLIEIELKKMSSDMRVLVVSKLDDFRKAMDEFRPNAVVSDFDLLTFNAFDILEALKAFPRSIPCLIVTGVVNDEETVAKLILSGAVGFIEKKNLLHIRQQLREALNEIDSTYMTNFNRYEQSLQRLHEIRRFQYQLNILFEDTPKFLEKGVDLLKGLDQIAANEEETTKGLSLMRYK